MPRRDGTGPRGEGPLTGRNFGPCKYENQYNDQNFNQEELVKKVDELKVQLDDIKQKLDK
ncbi:MAG: DUF5320 domain-containing protein [Bacilli bacterium]|nr:DUF5320 domain-containing protein [Bacilli bacterium]